MSTKTYIDAKSAVVTEADKGEFVAYAATYATDRQGERIVPSAFQKTIARWRDAPGGKSVPLLWDHRGSDPEYLIGAVDPASLEEVEGEGLRVAGKLDLDNSAKAVEAWRAMKTGALSLSFGFLTIKSRTAGDGVRELLELDLLEISAVPSPASEGTHFVELKGTDNKARHLEKHSDPSGELAWLAQFFDRDPDEVVREAKIKREVEAKAADAERKASLTVARFDVEVQ